MNYEIEDIQRRFESAEREGNKEEVERLQNEVQRLLRKTRTNLILCTLGFVILMMFIIPYLISTGLSIATILACL